MKSLLVAGLAVASLLVAGVAHARWESGATLITVNGGYLTAKSRLTSSDLSGATFNASLDFVVPEARFSFGLAIASMALDENGDLPSDLGGERAEIRTSSTPFSIVLKGWFGGDRVRGYGGVALGFHSSRVEASDGDQYLVQTSTGFGAGVPIGAVLFLGDNVFLHGNVTLAVLGDSFFDSNLAGMANLGAGFKLADW